ncbi:MAG: ABC transporter permease [Thermoplasmatota archaeon]
MNLRRTLAFSRRALLQFRHDRRTLGFILVMPLLMVVIFGYTFEGEVRDLGVDVVDMDAGIPPGLNLTQYGNVSRDFNLSARVRDRLDPSVLIAHSTGDAEGARERVRSGERWAAIVFPENFTMNFLLSAAARKSGSAQGPRAELEVYIDGSNPNIAGAILRSVNDAVISAINALAKEMNQSSAELPARVATDYAYGGPELRFIDYFAPGVMSFAIIMVTTMISIILFVFERRTGTLQRLLVSPATEAEIVTGYALAFAVIGVIQCTVVLMAATLLFGIAIEGNLLLAFGVLILLGFGHQGLGILLSSGARNELQAIQFIPIIIFPSVLLAGLFWPTEAIPGFLRPISYFVPLKYGIDAVRSIMLRGWGLGEVWPQVLALFFFACLTLGGSVALLKRRRG